MTGRACLRVQFHGEAGNEALRGRSSALDAIDAIAPMLTVGGSCGVQYDFSSRVRRSEYGSIRRTEP